MLGRHHLMISLATAVLIASPLLYVQPKIAALILIGVAVGSLAPDADSPDATIFHGKIKGLNSETKDIINTFIAPVLPFFGFVMKYLIYKPSILLLKLAFRDKYKIEERHRGFLHSFSGIIITSAMIGIYLTIILSSLKILNIIYLATFTLAYSLGMTLHLLEDAMTVTGVQINYPFSKVILKGNIVTNFKSTGKPNLLLGFLGVPAGVLLVIAGTLKKYSLWKSMPLLMLATASIWFIFMILIAQVRSEKGELKSYKSVKSLF